MESSAIVAFYVAINILILFVLSYLVIRQRRKHSIGIGDGGNEDLRRAIRVQGNFTEYAPLGMLALIMLAAIGAHPHFLWAIGGVFTLGRVMHAIGYSRVSGRSIGRFYGMVLTGLSLLVMATALIYYIFT